MNIVRVPPLIWHINSIKNMQLETWISFVIYIHVFRPQAGKSNNSKPWQRWEIDQSWDQIYNCDDLSWSTSTMHTCTFFYSVPVFVCTLVNWSIVHTCTRQGMAQHWWCCFISLSTDWIKQPACLCVSVCLCLYLCLCLVPLFWAACGRLNNFYRVK